VVVLLGAGIALALFQPGDLSDDETSGPAVTSPSTTAESSSTTASTSGGEATTEAPGATSTTGATVLGGASTTVAPAPTTSTPGGLGTDGAGQVNTTGEPMPNTGGPELVVPALVLLAAGVTLRLLARRLADE
jgi:hypothetical protein